MVKLDFGIEHNPAYKFNSQVIKALITDIFFQFMEEDVFSISQNEIMYILGIPEKEIDRYDNCIYDLKLLKKQLKGHNKSNIYEMIEK